MVLFTILALALIIVAVIALAVTGVVGAAVLALFGDVIVFALIVWMIVKLIKFFKKK